MEGWASRGSPVRDAAPSSRTTRRAMLASASPPLPFLTRASTSRSCARSTEAGSDGRCASTVATHARASFSAVAYAPESQAHDGWLPVRQRPARRQCERPARAPIASSAPSVRRRALSLPRLSWARCMRDRRQRSDSAGPSTPAAKPDSLSRDRRRRSPTPCRRSLPSCCRHESLHGRRRLPARHSPVRDGRRRVLCGPDPRGRLDVELLEQHRQQAPDS